MIAKPFRSRQKIRLGSLRDVRIELARVYKAGCNGEMPWQDATRAAHVLSIIGRLDEGKLFYERLAEVDARLATHNRGNGHAGHAGIGIRP